MHKPFQTNPCNCQPVVHHHSVCRHQIEVELLPASTEVYFADERYIDPINTQIRFSAFVYNAKNNNVTWQVTDITGGPGAGTIDPSGLYLAPSKGSIPHGHTDIVLATAKTDPTRRAYAKVTLIGHGPEPLPTPKLEIYPQVAHVYYQGGYGLHNNYIDISNKHQQFRSLIRHTALTEISWSVTGPGSINDGYYNAPSSGSAPTTVKVHAQLTHDSSVKSEARIILLNYYWPGIVS
jgi:hypothetical protein